jgi:hypothetical protein
MQRLLVGFQMLYFRRQTSSFRLHDCLSEKYKYTRLFHLFNFIFISENVLALNKNKKLY